MDEIETSAKTTLPNAKLDIEKKTKIPRYMRRSVEGKYSSIAFEYSSRAESCERFIFCGRLGATNVKIGGGVINLNVY